MSEKKEALPIDAEMDRASLKGIPDIHLCNCTTHDGRTQGRVAAALSQGEDKAVSSADLVQLLGFRSVRELQKQIEAERRSGALILSSSAGGYFLPANRAEIVKYAETLRRRAISTLQTLKTARAALKVLPDQEEINDRAL